MTDTWFELTTDAVTPGIPAVLTAEASSLAVAMLDKEIGVPLLMVIEVPDKLPHDVDARVSHWP